MIGQLLASTVGSVLDRVIPDKNARAEARERLEALDLTQEFRLVLGQLEINKVEAAHKSLFVAGWRPFIGWVCGVGLMYSVILQPIASMWLRLPPVNSDILMPVMLGMLGLGGMRSFEKFKRVQRER